MKEYTAQEIEDFLVRAGLEDAVSVFNSALELCEHGVDRETLPKILGDWDFGHVVIAAIIEQAQKELSASLNKQMRELRELYDSLP